MLDQLVESRDSFGDGARRGGFLLTTLVLVVSLFASGMLWSLFAKDFGMGDENLELSTLVAPVEVPAAEPPEPIAKEIKAAPSKSESVLPSRREIIARMDETPIVPKNISTAPNVNKERPNTAFTISPNAESDGRNSAAQGTGRGTGSNGNNVSQNIKSVIVENTETETAPPVAEKPKPAPKPDRLISLGVINGKAISLPKPAYSSAALSVGANGDVNVQVTIDEKGNVISAKAVSGHPLLKQVSENAARNAKFEPTLLSKVPVKVTGIIVYKFTRN